MSYGLGSFFSKAFNSVFPDDCRLCEQPLQTVSRIPVCASCLALPQPLQAEFYCRSCRTPFVSTYSLNEDGLCAMCHQGLTSFDAAYSFGGYEGALRKLIHLFKYGKVETLAGPLSRLLITAIPLDVQFDEVVAMPMHWRKQWESGFNQAELLAAPVSARYGLPLSNALRRRRYTQAQASLTEGQRRDNLIGSFFVKGPELIRGKRILLVDDVFTTGATLRSAADALKTAGAAHVTALTLARVDRKSPDDDAVFAASTRKRFLVVGRVPRREQDFTAILSDSAVPGSAEVGVT